MALFQTHRERKLLLLFLAGTALLCAGTPRPQDLSRALSSPERSGWALADFDGDNDFDLATASSGRHDARGYAQEVLVSSGSHQQSSFRFRSRSATVDLTALDIDGDQDHDLVVREPLSMKPIGVWLNDGAGFFHEGDLADYPELERQPVPSTWRVQRQRITLLAVFDERIPLIVPETSAVLPRAVVAPSAKRNDPLPKDPCRSEFRGRAPPRNS